MKQDLQTLQKRIMTALQNEQGNREKNREWVYDDIEGDSPRWVINERHAVLNEVNAIRKAAGKLPIAVETLNVKAERQACGHVDYTRKFALYAAELAMMD